MKSDHFTYIGQDQVWQDWLLPLKLNEIGLVISYPGSDVRRRVLQLQTQSGMVKKYLGTQGELAWRVGDYLRDKWDSVAELRKWLGAIETNVVVFVFGLEQMLRENRTDLIREIHDWYRSDSLRVLFFSESNYYDESLAECRSKLLGFSPRIIYHSIYSDNVLREFISYLSRKWNLVLLDEDLQSILEESGGILPVVKELVWTKLLTLKQDNDKLSAMSHVKFLWLALEEDSRKVLSYMVYDIPIDEGLYLASKYLETIGLIKEGKVQSSLLATYIEEAVANPRQIEITQNNLIIGGVDYTSHFSGSQRLLLAELIKNHGKVVSRDILIEKVWQQEGISDWAFDSHIKRLRDRLDEAGIGAKHIVTKRKQGLLWQ